LRQSPPILCLSMRATDTPSCAAPAATVRPPAPAPMTHISTRSSPPAASARLPLCARTATSSAPPERARTNPTAPSLGCCMAVPPPPQNDRNERNAPQQQQCQHELPGDERARMDAEPAGVGTGLGHAAGVFGLGGHDNAVETGPCRC